MFENITERLSKVVNNVRGLGRLKDDNIKDAIRDVRKALLEADVALPVVRKFIDSVRQRAIGVEVKQSLSPGQVFVKIVHEELIKLMGDACESLDLAASPPAVVLMAGLQGAGKTTSVAKLALYLKERENKKVMVTSCDIYRPAAIEQLQTLARDIETDFYPSDSSQDPVKIAKNAIKEAKKQFMDVLIIDTAGRLHIDDAMMAEIKNLHKVANPVETLFVVDSMTGQDAANTAKAFHEALPLTGVILTKADGDARGGAALSIRDITAKPIKFMGVGEQISALEPFHPERVASRILGMGDVLTLVEEVERKVDKEKAEKFAKKIQKGKSFDLEDFKEQIQQISKLGGISSMMDKMPGMGNVPKQVKDQVNDKEMVRLVAMINSMTLKERKFPAIIKGSRKKRIAAGSGTQVQDVNKLLKQFIQMQKMMKKVSKGGMGKMMRGMKGNIPQGLPF